MSEPAADPTYSAKDITVLEGLEPVRLRPGMYIGSTGARGLHHLVYEVVDNAVDEAMAGFNDSIEVTIHPDNSVTVVDRGRGIPVDVVEGTGSPGLTVVLTKLHAGGKFGGEGYKVSGGLHGVGVSVVNALSEWLVATVERDGKVYKQEFARGVPQGEMEIVGISKNTGTTVSFLPDPDIFEEREFSRDTLRQRLRETAFLTRGLRIKLTDEREGEWSEEFHFEGGIKDFVKHVNDGKDPTHGQVIYFEAEDEEGRGSVEIAMQWNSKYVESVFSFANNINTHEGGAHLSGFASALTATMNRRPPLGVCLGAHGHHEQGRLRRRAAQGRQGRAARGRGHTRGPRCGHLGQDPRAAVRGPDEDEARQPLGDGLRAADRQPEARRVVRGALHRAPSHRAQGDRRRPRPPGGAEGARHPAQGRALGRRPAGQARRLPALRPGPDRAFHRRGRLGRRLRQAGP
jgi:hypothetical protein